MAQRGAGHFHSGDAPGRSLTIEPIALRDRSRVPPVVQRATKKPPGPQVGLPSARARDAPANRVLDSDANHCGSRRVCVHVGRALSGSVHPDDRPQTPAFRLGSAEQVKLSTAKISRWRNCSRRRTKVPIVMSALNWPRPNACSLAPVLTTVPCQVGAGDRLDCERPCTKSSDPNCGGTGTIVSSNR